VKNKMATGFVNLRRDWTWLLVLFVSVLIYSISFSGFPIIEKKIDVLADADAANFVFLLKNFQIDKQFGDKWNTQYRSIADNSQKHKIHHVLYVAVGHALYKAEAWVFDLTGWGRDRAVYAVNAIFAGLNILLLGLLLRQNNPNFNPLSPFVIFYSIALSTWIYSSIPESWPFSATLVLFFLLLLGNRPAYPKLWGATLGVIMLNNIYLAALFVLIVLELGRTSRDFRSLLRHTLVSGIITLLFWLGGLTILSTFDQSFRPDQFVLYTIWFKQFTNPGLTATDLYTWKSAITNLFINSIVSNQPDPRLPQEALQTTLRTSVFGGVAIASYLLVICVAFVAYLRSIVTGIRCRGLRGLLEDPSTGLVLWCIVMLGVTVVLFYASGFLYSTVVVPVLAVFLCRNLDLRVPWQRSMLYITLAVILANNIDQIIKFRDALNVAF